MASSSSAQTTPREPHLVNLKVLRASRPTLVPSKIAYYDESNIGSSSLHALDQQMRSGPEYGLGGMLQLPSTFGIIYLGETFSALLCLSNDLPPSTDSTSQATNPVLKVEMHTAGPDGVIGSQGSMKHHLQTVNAPSGALAPGQSLDVAVSHDLTEPGLHALVCSITYAVQIRGDDGPPRMLSRSFRKVYKFQVSNPLSVRTKAHSPNPNVATAILSETERSKVFLEVQVQNQCHEALSFERMRFESVQGWLVEDINEGLFDESSALLAPGAVRQYVFVLAASPEVPYARAGSSQGLGRLNIVWRTAYGELGKLQTSMLGRRVPPEPPSLTRVLPQMSASGAAMVQSTPQRHPSSIPADESRRSIGSAPSSTTAAQNTERLLEFPDVSDLDFDLMVTSIEPRRIVRHRPLTVKLRLKISTRSPPSGPAATPIAARARTIRFAAQHVQWINAPHPVVPALHEPNPESDGIEQRETKQDIVLPSPVAYTTPPRVPPPSNVGPASSQNGAQQTRPPPPLGPAPPHAPWPSPELMRIGTSLVQLGDYKLRLNDDARVDADLTPAQVLSSQTFDFELKFLANVAEPGLYRVGGLRILALSDETEQSDSVDPGEQDSGVPKAVMERHAAVVLDLPTIAEVWVSSSAAEAEAETE